MLEPEFGENCSEGDGGVWGSPLSISVRIIRMPTRRRHRGPSLTPEARQILIVHRAQTCLPVYPMIQNGGARGTVSANGFRYRYWDAGNGATLLGGRTEGKRPCFILITSPDGTGVLHGLEQGNDCSMDYGATTKQTLIAAVNLAKQRGLTELHLTDNSTKHVPYRFRVSNVSFLTTGQTWYESVLPIHTDHMEDIERWRHQVRTNTWNSVWSCLLRRRPETVLPVSIADVDGDAAGSAMTVLSRIKTARTDFFARLEDDLLFCSGIGSLHGREWMMNMADWTSLT